MCLQCQAGEWDCKLCHGRPWEPSLLTIHCWHFWLSPGVVWCVAVTQPSLLLLGPGEAWSSATLHQ